MFKATYGNHLSQVLLRPILLVQLVNNRCIGPRAEVEQISLEAFNEDFRVFHAHCFEIGATLNRLVAIVDRPFYRHCVSLWKLLSVLSS